VAEAKTKPTKESVSGFLNKIPDAQRRADCLALARIMEEITGVKPRMWGPSMVGFGSYHYKYASGHEGDCFMTGFASRKQDLTVYVSMGFQKYEALMNQLGKHRTSKSCLYIKRLSDIDIPTLKKLLKASLKDLTAYIKAQKAAAN
jgi:uncharacterized protein DUF1801